MRLGTSVKTHCSVYKQRPPSAAAYASDSSILKSGGYVQGLLELERVREWDIYIQQSFGYRNSWKTYRIKMCVIPLNKDLEFYENIRLGKGPSCWRLLKTGF